MILKRTMSVLAAISAAVTLAAATPSLAQGGPAIWQGFYLGGTVGYGDADDIGPLDPTGAVYGFYGGYNHAFGPWVAGIEVDYTWADVEDTVRAGADRVTLGYDNLGSVRARIGYTFDQAMIYGTGGYGWGEAGTSGNVGGIAFSRVSTFDGFVLGGGLEYKFAPNVSGRVEGLHYWLEPDGADRDDLDTIVVRGGLTFHFN
jgi:outer membrane immunogenic protein